MQITLSRKELDIVRRGLIDMGFSYSFDIGWYSDTSTHGRNAKWCKEHISEIVTKIKELQEQEEEDITFNETEIYVIREALSKRRIKMNYDGGWSEYNALKEENYAWFLENSNELIAKFPERKNS